MVVKKIICFDIDNIICKTVNNRYINSKPNMKVINLINSLFEKGHTIKIFTARFMGRNNENITKAKKQGYNLTKKQLKKWNLKYHKLIFGKPSYDYYVDDKSIFYDKNWIKIIKKKIYEKNK